MSDARAEGERVPAAYKQRLVGLTRHGKYGDKGYWFSVRNGDYDQRIGDRLTRAVRYKERKYPQDCHLLPEIVEERQTDIRICEIKAYGEDLGTVGRGMTCLMALEGEDIDWLNGDWCFE